MSYLTEDLWRQIAELEAERDHLAKQLHAVRTERDQLRIDNARLVARLNRMVSSAHIDDVNWRPTQCANS